MLIAVPSYRRADNGQAQTFMNWPREMRLTAFVRQEEYDAYAMMLARLGRSQDRLVSIPDGAVSNISQTRNLILTWARMNDQDKVVMVDDDLHFITRGKIPDDDVHLRECDMYDAEMLARWFDDSLDKYAHAAVSMREGNNRVPGLGAQVECTRGIRMVGYNLPVLLHYDVKFRPEVDGREDLDMTLQLLGRGLPNVVTYHWAQGQKVANAPGGLSEYRDVAHSDASAKKLAELHPGFVTLRLKNATSAGEFGQRLETTIAWKKKLESARV